MKTISDRIFELLKERGMTQKGFAQKTDMSVDVIQLIADAYRCLKY